jgi:hypothetical protein
MSADYRFVTRWQFEAPIQAVWDAVSDLFTYPKWFPYFSDVSVTNRGGPDDIGSVYRVKVSTKLPYSLAFDLETVRREPPRLLDAKSTGQLEGSGIWELSEQGMVTTAVYHWNVRTTRRWMNASAPLLRPLFVWNHGKLMDAAGENLAKYLGVRLLLNESREERPSPNGNG